MAGDVTTIRLRDIERCFQGDAVASLTTCSRDGVPNITPLSIVHRVDDTHVGLSFQFFNKSRANILAQPRAQILVPDPATFEQYRIDIEYERTEQAGPLFERMRTNLDAIASQMRMTGIFRLQGIDVYRVVAIEKLACDLDLTPPQGSVDFLAGLETLATRLADCTQLDALLDVALKGLAELFDYAHSMILFANEAGTHLYTVASHGFPESGVGAELRVGEGLIGIAAKERRPVRMTHLHLAEVMGDAVRATARDHGIAVEPEHRIPLPGLEGMQSQLAVPIVGRDRIIGILCVQSTEAGRLTEADEQVLGTLARHLAASILLLAQGPFDDLRAAHGLGAASPAIETVDATDETAAEPTETAGRILRWPTRVADRYEIAAFLGMGGMGSVYRVRDLVLNEVVALKFLREHLARSPHMRDRFKDEVRVARRVTHPNVARTFDIGEHDGATFLTMELIDGDDLSAVLARDGAFSARRTIEVGRAICAGLAAAHGSGFVHRDLKLGNVMIEASGRVVLTDFGIACALADVADDAKSAGIRGTPAYMAPEQLEGRSDVDARADLYSLGAVLFELATATRAWPDVATLTGAASRATNEPPDPRRIRPDVAPELAAVIVRCLAHRPEDRYPSALAVDEALRACSVTPER